MPPHPVAPIVPATTSAAAAAKAPAPGGEGPDGARIGSAQDPVTGQARGLPASTGPIRLPLIASEDLLRGHKAVEINHQGVIYRLQATRQGKLILTK